MRTKLEQVKGMIESFPSSFGLVKRELLEKLDEAILEIKETCVSWTEEDFIEQAKDGFNSYIAMNKGTRLTHWTDMFNQEAFLPTLKLMIAEHDAEEGIHWGTIRAYIAAHCLKKVGYDGPGFYDTEGEYFAPIDSPAAEYMVTKFKVFSEEQYNNIFKKQ